jgi:DNA-binding CsgD family transcriptional regulator/tetratricopeptide (TPR) repeat protein
MTITVSRPGERARAAKTIRGRERERRAVLGLLKAAEAGRPGILLVEGEPGTGKSLLLDEAARTARSRGLSSAIGGGRELGQIAPVEPLLAALGEPLAAEGAVPGPSQLRLVEEMRTRLEKRAGAGPVLVSLDDLQWADPATLTALQVLSWQLGCYPVAWLLARCTTQSGNAAGRLFDLMERDGAERCTLTPLRDDALTEIVIDMLGAMPDPDVMALAAGAGGNPFLLTELLAGLRDEGTVRISGGRARLSSARLPDRVHAAVRHRLDGLCPRTRQLVSVTAVLGRSFSPEDVAEILGTTPAAILPELDEALSAGVLAATPDELSFRHDLVWQVATEAVPAPVRQALHRQIGELLIGRRGSAASAASHLVQGIRADDARALAKLDRAIAEVLPASPQTAADLAMHALELTGPAEPDRPARILTAVRALSATGRLDEAVHLARHAFTRPMPPVSCARLRCLLSEILHMKGQPAEAATEAAAALAEPCLPGTLRDDAELALLNAQAGAGDDARARERAAAIVSTAGEHGDALVTGAFVALALAEWDAGRLAAGLSLAREAVRRATSADARRIHPRMILAMLLTDVQRLDEARTVMASAGDDVETLGHLAWATAPAILRARLHLTAGRLHDAITEAEAALAATSGLGPHVLTSSALSVLAAATLRTGDVGAAYRYLECDRPQLPTCGSAYAQAGFALVAAEVAEAREGPGAVAETFGRLCEEVLRHRWALISDPTAAAWLVRTALALDDRPRAGAVVGAAERLARDNPGFPTAGVAAAHARGLLDRDGGALERAAAGHADPWARASATEDLGVLAAADPAADVRRKAVITLDTTLSGYGAIGAVRDAARVRRRLRRLGVRRRHWSQADRPVSGWASLTDTERSVSDLVAQGLTNRQVADQLFMSVHTVAFHLRHVFRKLDVGSRVELTRLALQKSA